MINIEKIDFESIEETIKAFNSACEKSSIPDIVRVEFNEQLNRTNYFDTEIRRSTVLTALHSSGIWIKAEKAAQGRDFIMNDLFWILYEAGESRDRRTRTQEEITKARSAISKKINKLIEAIEQEPIADRLKLYQVIDAMEGTDLEPEAMKIRESRYSSVWHQFPTATQYLKGLDAGFRNGFKHEPEIPRPPNLEPSRHEQFLTDIVGWFKRLDANMPEIAAPTAKSILMARGIPTIEGDDVDLKDAATRRHRENTRHEA